MKLSTTKKKFYNKWLFRCSYFLQVSDLREKISGKPSRSRDVKDIVKFLSTLDKDQYHTRVEKYTLDLYFNSHEIFDQLQNISTKHLFRCSIPDADSTELLAKNKVILCRHLPYHRYRYKIYLQPHRNHDKDYKKKYIEWLDIQQSKIYISDTTKQWFIQTMYNYDRRYMYAENEQMILLLKMKDPDMIGMIYQYEIYHK